MKARLRTQSARRQPTNQDGRPRLLVVGRRRHRPNCRCSRCSGLVRLRRLGLRGGLQRKDVDGAVVRRATQHRAVVVERDRVDLGAVDATTQLLQRGPCLRIEHADESALVRGSGHASPIHAQCNRAQIALVRLLTQ